MSLDIELILQFGVAGLALWFLYDMNRNHLKAIQKKLEDIEAILKDRL